MNKRSSIWINAINHISITFFIYLGSSFFFASTFADSDKHENSKLKVAIYYPSNPKSGCWDVHSVNTEISGTQYWIMDLAVELAKQHVHVAVYSAPCPGSLCTQDDHNPQFIDVSDIDWTEIVKDFDVLIVFRDVRLLEPVFEKLDTITASNKPLVYFHPIDPGPVEGYNASLIKRIKQVFWLSGYQRSLWCKKNDQFNQFDYISGIGTGDFVLFKPIAERENKYSCIYASDYHRGLETLLDCWKEIKKQYPESELNIYFGSRFWSPEKASITKKIKELSAYGVIDHGWVSSEELIRAYEKASFWTFPCKFQEMFCVSGLKAQIAGAVPIIYDTAALAETVRSGYKINLKESYLSLVLKAFKDASKISLEDRSRIRQKALESYSIEGIVNRMIQIFKVDLEASRKN